MFSGRLIHLFAGNKALPNGKKTYIEEVEHPGAALIVPFASDKIVFIRQYRVVIDKYIWELPAGIIAPGESPYACAKRETAEETGYGVRSLKKLGAIYTSPGFCNEMIHIFRADCAARKAPAPEEHELLRVRHFSKKEVVSLFASGKITDSKTIAALAFARVL
jgi:ADP-ribose pyrophosphatase